MAAVRRRNSARGPRASLPTHRAAPLVAASPATPTGPMADRDAGDANALPAWGRDCRTARDGSPVALNRMDAFVAQNG